MKKILIVALIFVMAMITNVYADTYYGVTFNGVGTGNANPPA